ncbi:hypothetical protein SAMN02745130_00997 [Thiothrix eikelboomii]|uniref:Uncharacterized protein n=1 Tax=Thiothrix eikelboomii TaxID=92487 RepID=A0A1T4W4K1_9GAMM|nr:hypothetical protein [Thiothrix eikelboomii]SKA72200.1 hypothetical protein SAMN02745130_00997 [Thiothrix eikelboomii]
MVDIMMVWGGGFDFERHCPSFDDLIDWRNRAVTAYNKLHGAKT